MRSFLLVSFLGLVVSACNSGSGADTAPQQGNPGGGNPPVGGGGGGAGGGGGSPAAVFDDAAIDLMHPGGFPSDLAVDANGVLYTMDDAQIPATVVAFSATNPSVGPLLSVTITAADLIDHDGTTPARAVSTFGNGLFGAFVGDIEIAFDRWLLVTVGAGNSLSDDFTNPLRLANLVVIDTQTAQIVQTVNLAWALSQSGQLSDGGNYNAIPQSLPAMSAFVPARNGTPTGKVFVTMSNGGGSSAGLQSFYQGTVQSWLVDFTHATPLAIDPNGRTSALDVTRTFVTDNYNAVGLTRYTNGRNVSYLLLTTAGASQFDGNFVAQPTTDAYLEFIDLDTVQWRDAWAVNLGRILPALQPLALGVDATGRQFGALASQTFAATYFLDLSGLEQNPVDTSALRLLQTVELVPGGAATAGSGFQPGIQIAPAGGTAVVSSFTRASLSVLALPADIELGTITVNPPPLTASVLGPAAGTIGALVVPGRGAADVFFVVNGTFDAAFQPVRSSAIGTLTVQGGLP